MKSFFLPIEASVVLNSNYMAVSEYYINRVSLSQDFVPKKCCYSVFNLSANRYGSNILWSDCRKTSVMGQLRDRQTVKTDRCESWNMYADAIAEM